jgi:hypothetical protein
MDRGMVSQDNVTWLQQSGRRYLLGASRAELKRWKKELLDERDWNVVREGVEVKLCQGPEGEETFVLCRSRERIEKEKAMHQRFSARIETKLKTLQKRLASARGPIARSPIDRQIGRLLERNRRAAQRFEIGLTEDPGQPSGLRLSWSVRSQWDEWAQVSEGCYVLRTNVTDWTPEQLWQAYIQLTQAEAAFRIHPARRTRTTAKRRYRAAHRRGRAPRTADSLRRAARPSPSHPARSTRSATTRKTSNLTRTSPNVVPTFLGS